MKSIYTSALIVLCQCTFATPLLSKESTTFQTIKVSGNPKFIAAMQGDGPYPIYQTLTPYLINDKDLGYALINVRCNYQTNPEIESLYAVSVDVPANGISGTYYLHDPNSNPTLQPVLNRDLNRRCENLRRYIANVEDGSWQFIELDVLRINHQSYDWSLNRLKTFRYVK